jgi:uncharacterized membrane protein YfcA
LGHGEVTLTETASMDSNVFELSWFFAATFAAALVTGIAGFAFGLIAAAIWLHVLTPLQTASLIIAFGLVVQGASLWKLRHALDWNRLWPFLLGGAIGVPFGVAALGWASPIYMRAGVGAVLVLYSIYGILRPALKPINAGQSVDVGVGFLNGVLGGATGLAGILTTVWCGLRGWSKDEQRAVFQPVGVSIFAMSAAWIGATTEFSIDTAKLFLLGLPILFAGTWLGLKLYGRLDEAGFRKLVLILLLVSGVSLFF